MVSKRDKKNIFTTRVNEQPNETTTHYQQDAVLARGQKDSKDTKDNHRGHLG